LQLQAAFGRIAIRSAYRPPTVNSFGNERQRAGEKGYSCASNEANFAHHIWDRRDAEGRMGATASSSRRGVNRRLNGTPFRRAKGTPLFG